MRDALSRFGGVSSESQARAAKLLEYVLSTGGECSADCGSILYQYCLRLLDEPALQAHGVWPCLFQLTMVYDSSNTE